MSKRASGYYWVRKKDPTIRLNLHDGWEPAFWVRTKWILLGSVDKLKVSDLELGGKIEPNLRLIVAKEYLKPAKERMDGYYWVKMPLLSSRMIPYDNIHEGWEPAIWDEARWHVLGIKETVKESNLVVGRQIIPKILQLLEENLALQRKLLETQEAGLKKIERITGIKRNNKG